MKTNNTKYVRPDAVEIHFQPVNIFCGSVLGEQNERFSEDEYDYEW